MTYTMSITYIIIAFAFLPLFIVCMRAMAQSYPELYEHYKNKATVAFAIFTIIIAFRLTCYLLISWNFKEFDPREMHYEIPFFVSEILLCLLYIYGLLRVYNTSGHEQEIEVDEINENLMVDGATMHFHELPLHEQRGESLYQSPEGQLYRQPLEGGPVVPVPEAEAQSLKQSIVMSSRRDSMASKHNALDQSYELR